MDAWLYALLAALVVELLKMLLGKIFEWMIALKLRKIG